MCLPCRSWWRHHPVLPHFVEVVVICRNGEGGGRQGGRMGNLEVLGLTILDSCNDQGTCKSRQGSRPSISRATEPLLRIKVNGMLRNKTAINTAEHLPRLRPPQNTIASRLHSPRPRIKLPHLIPPNYLRRAASGRQLIPRIIRQLDTRNPNLTRFPPLLLFL